MSRQTDGLPTEMQGNTAEAAAIPLPDVINLIKEAVQRQPSSLLGTYLATLIRATFPGFSYTMFGAGRLREFLEIHVPEVVQVGRQGGDVLYGWRTPTEASMSGPTVPAPQTRTADEVLWRAFSSPNSERVVTMQVNAQTGAWRSVDPGTAESGEWLNVPPLPSEGHHRIASRFLETLGDDERREKLEAILNNSGRWWMRFREAVLSYPDLNEVYRTFRTGEMVTALHSTLDRLGLSESSRETAIGKVAPPILAARIRGRGEATPPNRPRRGPEESPAFRLFALRVLGRIPVEELRAVRVRLGDVFDALEQQS
jgi:hypothetical protein